MVQRMRIVGTDLEFGAKFPHRGFKLLLLQVDQSGAIMGFGEPGIEAQSIADFTEGVGIILLLSVGLPQQKVDRRVTGILLQQLAKDTRSSGGLLRAHEGRSPRKEQARIIGRMLEHGPKYIDDLWIVFQHEIAEAQNLAGERVAWLRRSLTLKRWHCFGVLLSTETGQSPVTIQAGEIWLPCVSLFEKLGRFQKPRGLRPHHPQVIVRTSKDFCDKRAVSPGCFRFSCGGWLLANRTCRQALLDHDVRSLLFFRRSSGQQISETILHAALAVVFTLRVL